jgi:site-specific recombinase XerD
MRDTKTEFIQSIEESLVGHLSSSTLALVSSIITKKLSDYDITERCTSVSSFNTDNDRILKLYNACLLVDGKSQNTVKMYLRHCKSFSDFIRKRFTEMTAYDLRFYLANEMSKGLKGSTRETKRAVISSFFQWMYRDGIIDSNPMVKIKPIKYDSKVKKPLYDIDIDKIRRACIDKRERAVIEMLLSTGVRVSELVNMQVGDIDKVTLAVHVKHGKGNKERITFTTPVSMYHVLEYISNRKEAGDYLIYNKNHDRIGVRGIQRMIKRIAKRAGVSDVYPHRFRRTFATNLSKRGMNVQDIQVLMGHTDSSTTMGYIALDSTSIHVSYQKYTV